MLNPFNLLHTLQVKMDIDWFSIVLMVGFALGFGLTLLSLCWFACLFIADHYTRIHGFLVRVIESNAYQKIAGFIVDVLILTIFFEIIYKIFWGIK